MKGSFEQKIWNNSNHMGGVPMYVNKNFVVPVGLFVATKPNHCYNNEKLQIGNTVVIHDDIELDILEPIEKKYVQKKEKSKSNQSKKNKTSKKSKSSKKKP